MVVTITVCTFRSYLFKQHLKVKTSIRPFDVMVLSVQSTSLWDSPSIRHPDLLGPSESYCRGWTVIYLPSDFIVTSQMELAGWQWKTTIHLAPFENFTSVHEVVSVRSRNHNRTLSHCLYWLLTTVDRQKKTNHAPPPLTRLIKTRPFRQRGFDNGRHHLPVERKWIWSSTDSDSLFFCDIAII